MSDEQIYEAGGGEGGGSSTARSDVIVVKITYKHTA